VRSACSKLATALTQRPQQCLRGVTSTLRKLSMRGSKPSSLPRSQPGQLYCSSSDHGSILVASQASALRVLLCRCYLQACRLQRQSGCEDSISGTDSSDSDEGNGASSVTEIEVEGDKGPDVGTAALLEPQTEVTKRISTESRSEAGPLTQAMALLGQPHGHVLATCLMEYPAVEVASQSIRDCQSTAMCAAEDLHPSASGKAEGPGVGCDQETAPRSSVSPEYMSSATKLRRCWFCGREELKMKKCSGCR
jgi:hypothetical protein